jgi:hypothetical protein
MLFGTDPQSRLPDCKSILFTIKATQKLDPRSAARYIALCRLTGVALAMRWIAIGLLVRTAIVIAGRGNMRQIAISCALIVASVVIFAMLVSMANYLASEYELAPPGRDMSVSTKVGI